MGAEIDRLEIQVETSASQANKQLDALVAKMEKLSSQMNGMNISKLSNLGKSFNKVTSSTNTASKSIGTISSRLQNMNSLLNKSKASTNSLASSFGMFYATMFPIIRGVKKLGSSIESSMDYMETYNYFNVAMQKIGKEFGSQYKKFGYDSADSYAKSFQSRLTDLSAKMTGYKVDGDGLLNLSGEKSLGLDAKQLMAFQAKIAQVTNSVGLMGEISTNASQVLSMLSADMASLYNVDLKSVMTNLSSGLIGQSRALYKYGIDITNANLQNYAFANGISKTVAEMSQSEKMQLRLLAILEQSRTSWGDMANTLNLPANQLRVLRQNLSNLARTIGNLFLPIVAKVLPYINALVVAVKRLFEWLGGLFHINEKLAKIGVNTGVGFNDDISDMVDESEDVANNAGDIDNNLSDAEKSARKLKNTLLGFDQVNALNDNGDISNIGSTGTANGVGGAPIDLSGAIGDALAEYQKVWNEAFSNMQNKAEETADRIQAFFKRMYDAMSPFRNAVKNLWNEGLSELASFTGTALIDFYHEFLVPIGTWAFGTEGSGLTRLVDVINNGLMAINWDKLNKSLKDFWIAIEPYAEQFGEGIIDFFEDVVGLGVDVINGFPGLLDKITGALNRGDPAKAREWGYNLGILLTALLGFKAVTFIIGGIASLGNSFVTLSTGLGALFGKSGLFAKMGGGIAGLFGEKGVIGSLFAEKGIFYGISTGPIIAIAAGIAVVIAGIIDLWKTSETFRDNVKRMWDIIAEAFASAKVKIWDNGLKPLWDSIKELFGSLYQLYEGSGLKTIFEAVVTGIGYIASVVLAGLVEGIASFVQFLVNGAQILIDIINGIVDVAIWLKDSMFEVWDWIKGKFTEFQEFLGNVFATDWSEKFGFFGKILNVFFDTAKSVIDSTKRIFGGIIDFVAGVFTGDWERAWNGIKDIFGGIWDRFTSIVKAPINAVLVMCEGLANGIIKAFNGIKKTLNKLSFDIPDWIPEFGGKSFGLHFQMTPEISLPRLAKGGLVDSGQLFIAREKGPELVGMHGNKSAVMNNDQLLDTVTDSIKDILVESLMVFGGNSGNEQPPTIEVIIQEDSETTYRRVLKGKKKHDRRYSAVVSTG